MLELFHPQTRKNNILKFNYMKRIITVIMLAMALVCGGGVVNAQKKGHGHHKGGKVVSITRNKDGYPNIIGHTYQFTLNGAHLDFTFNADDLILTIAGDDNNGSNPESETCTYTYENGCVKIYHAKVEGKPIFEGQISKDGKKLDLTSGSTMTLVK